MKVRKIATIIVSSLLGLVVGGLVLGPNLSLASPHDSRPSGQHASTQQGKYRDPQPDEVVASPPYPVNENGQTYGSGMNIDANNPGPDLIAAYGTDGAFVVERPLPSSQSFNA